jgi:hypothetical protein
MNRVWSFLVLLMIVVSTVTSASARELIPLVASGGDTLKAVRVQSGDSWSTLSAATNISVAELARMNGLLKPRPPFIGELVFVNDPSSMGISRWNYIGGAPAQGTVLEQIQELGVPDEVKAKWRIQVQTEMPMMEEVRSDPANPLILAGLTQHDAHLGQNVAKGVTICKWFDGAAPVYSTKAEVWDPVIVQGMSPNLSHRRLLRRSS